MVGFIGGVLLPIEALLVLYLALCLAVVGIIARVTYKEQRTFAWIFSSVSLLLTIYGVLKNFFSLISN